MSPASTRASFHRAQNFPSQSGCLIPVSDSNLRNPISNRFSGISTRGLSAFTHELSEWVKNFKPDTSRPIPWTDALASMGSEDRIAAFEEKLAEQEVIDSICCRNA